MTLTNTAKARIMLTVGLLMIAGMVLDASTGVVDGVDAIAFCLADALSSWAIA